MCAVAGLEDSRLNGFELNWGLGREERKRKREGARNRKSRARARNDAEVDA